MDNTTLNTKYFRIKTNDEMVAQYGESWRRDSTYMWVPTMENILNKLVDAVIVNYISKHITIDDFSVHRHMVKEITAEENAALIQENIKRFPFLVSNDNNNWIVRGTGDMNNMPEITITTSPTGNCQICSMGYCENILYNSRVDKIKSYLRDIVRNTCKKPLLLIDIHQKYESLIKELEDWTVFNQPYTSSNGSKMMIILLKIKSA